MDTSSPPDLKAALPDLKAALPLVGKPLETLTLTVSPVTGKIDIAGHVESPARGWQMWMAAAEIFHLKLNHEAEKAASARIVLPGEAPSPDV